MIATTLGHFRITAQLGAGGMGVVYRACDERLDREVAIKVLPAEVADDPDRLARFEREAKALAKLSHPNILAVFEVDVATITDPGTEGVGAELASAREPVAEDGQGTAPEREVHYLVTELLEGETLRERVEPGPVPWRKAIEIAAAIADGLAAAHGKGIIHRDLKPENVFITADGHVKVLDFGLVKVQVGPAAELETLTSPPPGTAVGTVMGTVGYMAPEQVRGESADARSDIFSLGCVLHEMLTGSSPFKRDTAVESMSAILKEDPPELSLSGVEVTPEINRFLGRCLEKQPAQRFQSAADLAFALRSLASSPVGAAAAVGPGTGDETGPPSIAVLPFANLSPDPDNAFFADGLTEELITDLSQVPTLLVISRNSAMQLRGTTEDARSIGRRLGVRYLLQGSVRRAGRNLRVTVQLVDTATDAQLWADKYAGTLEDVFAIQEQVSRAVVDALRLRLTRETRRTRDVRAYDAYLNGRFHLERLAREDVLRSIECFDQAVALDPAFAQPYAALGEAHWCLYGGWAAVARRDSVARARSAAEHALRLDPDLAEAHVTLAMIATSHDWDRETARMRYQRAIVCNGNLVSAHAWYASHLLFLELDPAAAMAEIELAERLDPLSLLVKVIKGTIYLYGSPPRADQAFTQFREIAELDPRYALGHYWLSYAYLALADLTRAVTEADQAFTLGGADALLSIGCRGYIHARAGNEAVAREAIADLEDRRKRGSASSSWIARVHAGLGEWDRAFDWLEEAYAERDPSLCYCAVETEFAPARGHLRFRRLLAKMGFELPEIPGAEVIQPEGEREESIVVLPFENLSPDPDNAFFTDGLTEELIADLSKVGALKVISRTSAFAFRGTAKTVPAIARELKVRYVLEGSVRRAGNNLRITAQLIDTESDAHLWAEKYDGVLDDVFEMQERVSRSIVAALKLTLSPEEERRLGGRRISDPRAYDAWLRAKQAAMTMTAEGFERGRTLVEQGLQLVGDNPLLLATLGWLRFVRYGSDPSMGVSELEEAERLARRALAMEADHPWALFVLGIVHHRRGDMQRFVQLSIQSLEVERNSHVLSSLAAYLGDVGRTDTARRYAEEGLDLDPLSWIGVWACGYLELLDGEIDSALRRLREGADRLAPGEAWPAFSVGFAAVHAGEDEEALGRFAVAAETAGLGWSGLGAMFHAALRGDRQALFETFEEKGGRRLAATTSHWSAMVASCFARAGETEHAIEWVQRAVEMGFTNHRYLGELSPLLAPLRNDRRMRLLLDHARRVEEAFDG